MNRPLPSPKFTLFSRVSCRKESGCILPGKSAQIIDRRYVSCQTWSGWVYKLNSDNLSEPIEIGEIWLEQAQK